MRQFLIITADDFGLHAAVNEAVERAHRHGVLTAASLMVAAPEAADAVRRARALPRLRVGLHVVLADGRASLAPESIPALVDADGHMDSRMFARGLRYFASPRVRRQLAAEIRAQFAAFAATGLPLDHVNAHKHFHLHPTLLRLLIEIGRDFGVAAFRVPDEPSWFAAGTAARMAAAALSPWITLMKRKLDRAGMFHNDRLFGMAASGAMTEDTLLRILGRLPPGVTEVYLHPATESGTAITSTMQGYRHRDELSALVSERVRAAVTASGIACGGFADARQASPRFDGRID